MKALININTQESSWAGQYFPDHSLYTLSVAAKPLGEYYLDFCSRLEVEAVRILDFNYDWDWGQHLQAGRRWPCQVDYRGFRCENDCDRLLRLNADFCRDDEVLLLLGFVFLNYDLKVLNRGLLAAAREVEKPVEGVYLFSRGKYLQLPVPCSPLDSIRRYFDLNFAVLQNDSCFSLPSYKVEAGVLTGMNDVIMPGVEISGPVLLGDNVCLERGCVLSGEVIIGHHVIVDSGCHLQSCIITENSYVAEEMELVGKIVCPQQIIDPLTGSSLLLEDSLFVSDLRNNMSFCPLCVVEWVAALLLLLALTPLYLGWLLYQACGGSTGAWFYKLSLDRYRGLWQVLGLRRRLVGNALPPETAAVFCYSDRFSMHRNQFQQGLDDSYFRIHGSFYQRFSIIVRSFINHLFLMDFEIPK